MFSQHSLDCSFPRIAQSAARFRTHVMLHIFGGAALLLTTDIRLVAEDIDRLSFTGSYGSFNERMLKKILGPLIRSSAQSDILENDPVANIQAPFSNIPLPHDVFQPYGTYVSTDGDGLSVWVAPPKMVLASKATSNREKDIHDCANICWMLGIDDPEELRHLVNQYFTLTPQLVRARGANRDLSPDDNFGEIFETLQGLKESHEGVRRPQLKSVVPKFVPIIHGI